MWDISETEVEPRGHMSQILPPNFTIQTPPGEDRPRQTCGSCGFINYVNPKIVAGVVVSDEMGRILLCRRAIEPRKGFWTVPAGFMEERESTSQGAAREVMEEACAQVEIDALLGIYEVPRISQVHFMYRGKLVSEIAAGPESLEVGMFEYDNIPWDDMAFPTGVWALRDWATAKDQAGFVPFSNPAGTHAMTHG
jgi:ADP-ribose pyrophosphatase YjhB (NUDIX family)